MLFPNPCIEKKSRLRSLPIEHVRPEEIGFSNLELGNLGDKTGNVWRMAYIEFLCSDSESRYVAKAVIDDVAKGGTAGQGRMRIRG
jgi:hypothetical protein